ncbi:MAG: hypothetical protein HY716_15260 [Planctomycetes bacterium]|nr:hypothetical protein [Planctomycetota bacterium]
MSWLRDNLMTLLMALFLSVLTWVIIKSSTPPERAANPLLQPREIADVPVNLMVAPGVTQEIKLLSPEKIKVQVWGLKNVVKSMQADSIQAYVHVERPDMEPGEHRLPIQFHLRDGQAQGTVTALPASGEPANATIKVTWK